MESLEGIFRIISKQSRKSSIDFFDEAVISLLVFLNSNMEFKNIFKMLLYVLTGRPNVASMCRCIHFATNRTPPWGLPYPKNEDFF